MYRIGVDIGCTFTDLVAVEQWLPKPVTPLNGEHDAGIQV
jgi:hypothetical protein